MMFKKNDIVRHVKTGNEYAIALTPDTTKIEADCTPVYVYCDDTTTWIRPQAEMEDGRFEFVSAQAMLHFWLISYKSRDYIGYFTMSSEHYLISPLDFIPAIKEQYPDAVATSVSYLGHGTLEEFNFDAKNKEMQTDSPHRAPTYSWDILVEEGKQLGLDFPLRSSSITKLVNHILAIEFHKEK